MSRTLEGIQPFDPPTRRCAAAGSRPPRYHPLFYCVPDDYVGWDNVDTIPTVYRQGGDFAVATCSPRSSRAGGDNRANDQSDDGTQSLRGDCFAGAYTASVILGNRAATSSFRISPGDLDEATTRYWSSRGDGDTGTARRGPSASWHYRDGVLNGAGSCLKNWNRYPSDE